MSPLTTSAALVIWNIKVSTVFRTMGLVEPRICHSTFSQHDLNQTNAACQSVSWDDDLVPQRLHHVTGRWGLHVKPVVMTAIILPDTAVLCRETKR